MNAHAMDIHYSSNSLKDLCSRLSDPEYVRLLKATVDKNTKEIMESNRYVDEVHSKFVTLLKHSHSLLIHYLHQFKTNMDDSVQLACSIAEYNIPHAITSYIVSDILERNSSPS